MGEAAATVAYRDVLGTTDPIPSEVATMKWNIAARHDQARQRELTRGCAVGVGITGYEAAAVPQQQVPAGYDPSAAAAAMPTEAAPGTSPHCAHPVKCPTRHLLPSPGSPSQLIASEIVKVPAVSAGELHALWCDGDSRRARHG